MTAAPSPQPQPAPLPAVGQFAVSTTANRGWSSIDVAVNGLSIGTLRFFFEPGATTSCAPTTDARVVTVVPSGNVNYTARSNNGFVWSGSQTVQGGGCAEVQLTCPNRDCTPAPPPTPSAAGTWTGRASATACRQSGPLGGTDYCHDNANIFGRSRCPSPNRSPAPSLGL